MSDENFICCDCVGDVLLAELMKGCGEVKQCSYCDNVQTGESLAVVAGRVDEVYREFYGYGESYPVFSW